LENVQETGCLTGWYKALERWGLPPEVLFLDRGDLRLVKKCAFGDSKYLGILPQDQQSASHVIIDKATGIKEERNYGLRLIFQVNKKKRAIVR